MAARNGIVYLVIWADATGDHHVTKVHCFCADPNLTKTRITRDVLPRTAVVKYFEPCKDQSREGWIKEISEAAEAINLDPQHVPLNNRDLANIRAAEAGIVIPAQ